MAELSKEAREKQREYMRAWREKNKKKSNTYLKEWRANNPEKIKQYNINYWEKKVEQEQEEA